MVRGENRMKLTWRIWLMLIFLVASILLIPNFQGLTTTGVIVKSIDQNSTAFDAGLRSGDIITDVNNQQVSNFNLEVFVDR